MKNQQPDPNPPDFRPVPPPSWLTYFALTGISIILILIAFSIGNPDWPGFLINLASGIITAMMFLIIIDRKFRVNEFSSFQIRTSTLATQIASILSPDVADTVGYAKIFSNQIHKIRPSFYVERPEFENLLDKYPNGFFIYGVGGIGKTTLVQTIAIRCSEQLVINPNRKMIPVLIPVRNWHTGNIIEQINKEIDKFYPVRKKVLQNWIRNKPMLLIFDGLDEHPNPEIVIMEIETLRKLAKNLTIIVTSRTVSKQSELEKVNLPGLTEQETKKQIELIGSSLHDLTSVIDRIYDMTKGHPLANSLAANLIKTESSTTTNLNENDG